MSKKAFIFPGQGSQSIGMAKEFYENFDAAKEVFEEVNSTLGKNLTKIMFEGPEDLLTDTENAQPAIMTASIAILRVLEKESGKNIDELCSFVAGHSLGEYTALCASESLSLVDTARLLKVRGEAFAEASKKSSGTMMALVGATVEQAEEVAKKAKIEGEICQIANDNTVGQIVLSGNVNSMNKAIEIATEMKIKRAIVLKVAGAFHSELMLPAVEKMKEILQNVVINEPKVKVIANYTANIEDKNDIKSNLIKQITGTVKWRETMLLLERLSSDNFVEVGSSKVLTNMVSKTCKDIKVTTINSVESLNEFLKDL